MKQLIKEIQHNKLLWLLSGNFGNDGGQYIPTSVIPLAGTGGSRSGSGGGRRSRRDPLRSIGAA